MSEGFLMTPAVAMLFFRYCLIYKIPNDEKKRVEILRRITAKKKARYIRDGEAFLKGKKIVVLKERDSNGPKI